jgi:hypothetical protein
MPISRSTRFGSRRHPDAGYLVALSPVLGLLDPSRLPITAVESTRKVLDPTLPSNELMRRAGASRDR